jgi:hypothetical protein
MSVSLGI